MVIGDPNPGTQISALAEGLVRLRHFARITALVQAWLCLPMLALVVWTRSYCNAAYGSPVWKLWVDLSQSPGCLLATLAGLSLIPVLLALALLRRSPSVTSAPGLAGLLLPACLPLTLLLLVIWLNLSNPVFATLWEGVGLKL